MACSTDANQNNFIRWKKIVGSLSLVELQAGGIPAACDIATGEDSFITQWNTALVGESNNNQIELPLVAGGTYDFFIEWGDGQIDKITSHADPNRKHTYPSAGVFEAKITGTVTGWNFPSAFGQDDKDKLTLISNWGPLKFTNLSSAFQGCSNLEISAVDVPDLSLVTSLANYFKDSTLLTGVGSNFNGWDVSSSTSFVSMFEGTPFNQDIGSWDVSSATTLASMFNGNASFNQDIGAWNTLSVLSFNSMFKSATAFNQDLGSLVIDPLTDAADMFDGVTLSTVNYDALLIGWQGQLHEDNVTFDGGGSKYSAGAAATARAVLVSDGWIIADGGQV